MSFEEEEKEEETFKHTLLVLREVSRIEPHLWDTSVANGFSPIRYGSADSTSYRGRIDARSGARIRTLAIYSRLVLKYPGTGE
ncbi:hypothetical protein YC2023_073726 [Brassica napus]